MLSSPVALTCVRGKAGLRVVRAAEEDDVDSVDVTPVVRPKLLVFKAPERKPTSDDTPGSHALPFAGSPFYVARIGPPCVLVEPLATSTPRNATVEDGDDDSWVGPFGTPASFISFVPRYTYQKLAPSTPPSDDKSIADAALGGQGVENSSSSSSSVGSPVAFTVAKPPTVSFQVHIFGAHGQRIRSFKLIVPCNLDKVRVDKEAAGLMIFKTITAFQRDIKHSGEWGCFCCAQPAHEAVHMPVSYLASTPSQVIDWVLMICRTSAGPCRELIESRCKDMARVSGMSWINELPSADIGAGEVSSEPVAAACASCLVGVETIYCPYCFLTRYCSFDCMRKDKARHSIACEQIGAWHDERREAKR